MSNDRTTDRNSIQVIARAAEILRLLVDHPDGLSLGEIAERTDLARSTVQRIVKALADEQFIVPASNRGGAKLGHGLIPLGNAARIDIGELALPFLQELADAVEETVDLSILSDTNALFIAQIPGSHRLAAISSVGEAFPLHSTANGKALLSCLSTEKRAKYLRRKLSQDTANTMTAPSEILASLSEFVRTGLTFDLEEHTDGICAVGTAFIDQAGRPHAISIPVPKARFEKKQKKLLTPLLECRNKLVTKIGGLLPGQA